jgi:hypothetical protein
MTNSKSNSQKVKPIPAPELPKEARLPNTLEQEGCHWLDEYVDFSSDWSPRSYDGYHEAIGLWILSMVAARRVAVIFGKERFTNLYMLLVGRTSLYSKTTAVQIARDFLQRLGLDYLLLPADCTPQYMLTSMVSKVPDDWEGMNVEQKEMIRNRLAFAGQKGWYYDEFGQNLSQMMRKEGPYSEFRRILRKFDDTDPTYEKGTIGRGIEVINRPYLALLGALTPADLAPFAYSGSSLWGDGYLARMGLIVPPSGLIKNDRFPIGERQIPSCLLPPIKDWHEQLGIPKVGIVEGKLTNLPTTLPSKILLSDESYTAYYHYDDALRTLMQTMNVYDFDGNYARFPEKALRIAGLFASLEQSSEINLNHWAKAQGITERWRSNLHSLYKQLTEENTGNQKWTDEQKVQRVIKEKGAPTIREIHQYTGLKNEIIQEILVTLQTNGKVISEESGKTTRYSLHSSKEG